LSALVVDASVLLVAILNRADEAGGWAESTLGERTLIAPHIVHVEVTNALRRLYLSKRLSLPQLRDAVRVALAFEIELEPYAPYASRVLELLDNVRPYDAWYVALAEFWGAPLATLDERLASASGPRCSFLLPGA